MDILSRFTVRVPLEAPKPGAVTGCAKAEVVVIEAILKDSAGDTVNVHHAAYPKGAVRGQLAKEGVCTCPMG